MPPTAHPALPTGTVTFLFTDIEGSTRILQGLGDRYRDVLAQHHQLVREALAAHDGIEVGTEGDAFFAVFALATDAIAAAADLQPALATHSWPDGVEVRVRIGLHTGEGQLFGDDYVGLDVHRAARIASAGHGGQILLSGTTTGLVTSSLPEGVRLRDLGMHRLKDIDQPEQLSQLTVDGLPDRFPSLRTIDVRQTNLPAAMTSFIGRADEIAEVHRLLGQTRLLTFTGPGGTGKTRLALEVARRALDGFADGVYFVPLDAVRDPGLVASVVAQAIGLVEGGRAADEALLDELAQKQLLLVLDNFEQILPAGELVERLLTAAPDLRVLITSRVPLQLYGEQEYEVAPLALPGPHSTASAEALSQYEAVALFIDRARAVSPRFEVTNANAPAVVEICVRLDGLPLAIELAAARVKVLPPEAILARLGQRLDLLSGQSSSVPPRQRTLRGAIDWSWDLLAETEQRLFERLAVFSGGWSLPAAEAVCAPGELGIDLLDGIAVLLDNSLVRRSPDLEPRFMMLQTVQEYGRERLAARGDAAIVASRHAGWVQDLVRGAEPELEGPDPARAVRRLGAEQENLRTALAWTIETGDAATGIGIAAAAWRFWQVRGQLREGRGWLDQLLAMPAARERDEIRARALTAAGGIAYWQGDPAARGYYEEALGIRRAMDDPQGIADALQNLAFTVMATDMDEGIQVFQESLDRYRELGDERNIASVLGALAYGRMMTGRHAEARPAFEEALERNLALGVAGRANDNGFALGHLDRLAGNLTGAAARYRESLSEVRTMADAARTLMQLRAVGPLAVAAGRHGAAVRMAGAVERAREDQGGTLSVPLPGVTDPIEDVRAAGTLSEEAIATNLAAGREMELDEAVDFALSLLSEIERGGGSPS